LRKSMAQKKNGLARETRRAKRILMTGSGSANFPSRWDSGPWILLATVDPKRHTLHADALRIVRSLVGGQRG